MDDDTPNPQRYYRILRIRSNRGLLSDIQSNILYYVSDAIGALPRAWFYIFFFIFFFANWFLYRNYPSDGAGHDLIANLFAGSIDSIFTILMLSVLAQTRHNYLQRDMRCLLCNELMDIHNRFVVFLYRLYRSCDGHIDSDDFNFTSEEAFEFMLDKRDLDKSMVKDGQLTCRNYVSREMQRLTNSLDRIFMRYGAYIDTDTLWRLKSFESAKILYFYSNLHTTFQDVEFLPYDYKWITNDIEGIENLFLSILKISKKEKCIAVWPLPHNIKSIKNFLESNTDPSYIYG